MKWITGIIIAIILVVIWWMPEGMRTIPYQSGWIHYGGRNKYLGGRVGHVDYPIGQFYLKCRDGHGNDCAWNAIVNQEKTIGSEVLVQQPVVDAANPASMSLFNAMGDKDVGPGIYEINYNGRKIECPPDHVFVELGWNPAVAGFFGKCKKLNRPIKPSQHFNAGEVSRGRGYTHQFDRFRWRCPPGSALGAIQSTWVDHNKIGFKHWCR
jgi:hypothetical protein